MRRVESFFNSGNDLPLGGEGFAGNPSAGCGGMTAAAELRGDVVDVDAGTLRAETDSSQFRFHFFKDTCNNYRSDGADVINEPFRIAALRAGPGEVRLLKPEI